VALVLAGAGAVMAAYLAVQNLQGETGTCIATHGCARVQNSAYGKILGVPVSVPGFAMYSTLLIGAIAWLVDFRGLRRDRIVAHSQIKRPETKEYHGGHETAEGYAAAEDVEKQL